MNKKEIDFDNINIITVAKVASANFLRCNYKNKINEKHHGHSLLRLKNVIETQLIGIYHIYSKLKVMIYLMM